MATDNELFNGLIHNIMSDVLARPQPIFEVKSVLGKTIRTNQPYFERILTVKHPELIDTIKEVLHVFVDPVEVWHGGQDIYLYYHKVNHHHLVAVARHLNGDGFLITAYRTSKKKRKGIKVWPRQK